MQLDRNLGMDLVRCTEAAALRAARLMGRGDKDAADQAAVDAMRFALNGIVMDGVVVIGEGEKDNAPMLYTGERVGTGAAPAVDIAVDPVEGTTLLAEGMPGAIAVIAVAERGALHAWNGIPYMYKLAVGEAARGKVDINASVAENVNAVAHALRRRVSDITVVVLDRPRHHQLIREIRAAGARIRLIAHGDVAAGVMTAVEDAPADMLMGIGGAPEAVVTACALKCLGGEIHARLWPRDDHERELMAQQGLDPDYVYSTDELVKGENVYFVATGITSGDFLRGVQYSEFGARTHSVVMRATTGTIRHIESFHRWDKLMRVSGIDYRPNE
jgi:fructose-1,6-bisphosphatase II